ncbi:MAG: hypothetical protein DCC88_02840 [Spirobacillus cienkowskii]|jgi:hypothetical protein|uniref:Uncharacterized protein n=1 Tax=Spirobacillus cienkowskii TaxID=495820 RepID=A0A369KYQ7_9BACT|nr:MAG: hypothetical protein DCC88_02840 [Spirobacillus cienkowskii]
MIFNRPLFGDHTKYLQTDFVRFLVSIKKITQDMTKDTWCLVPMMDLQSNLTDLKLYNYFNLTKEEQAHIKKKVQEWS